jgi:hypothetical protein
MLHTNFVTHELCYVKNVLIVKYEIINFCYWAHWSARGRQEI